MSRPARSGRAAHSTAETFSLALSGIVHAFREHLGIPSGRLPDDFSAHIDESDGLDNAAQGAVTSAAWKAATELEHSVLIALSPGWIPSNSARSDLGRPTVPTRPVPGPS
jgi:hypothetical protein